MRRIELRVKKYALQEANTFRVHTFFIFFKKLLTYVFIRVIILSESEGGHETERIT